MPREALLLILSLNIISSRPRPHNFGEYAWAKIGLDPRAGPHPPEWILKPFFHSLLSWLSLSIIHLNEVNQTCICESTHSTETLVVHRPFLYRPSSNAPSLPHHSSFTAPSQPLHRPFTAPAPPLHRPFTTPSPPIHPSPPGAPSSPLHRPFTTPSPPLHHPFTTPSPPLHHPFTTPSPPLHHPFTLGNCS